MNEGDKIRAVCDYIEQEVTDRGYDWPNTSRCFIGHGQRAGIIKAHAYENGVRELGFHDTQFACLIGHKNRMDAVRIMREYANRNYPLRPDPMPFTTFEHTGMPDYVRRLFRPAPGYNNSAPQGRVIRQKEEQCERQT